MEERLLRLKNEASGLLYETDTLDDLNRVRLEILGKHGKLAQVTKEIAELSLDERPGIGRLANEIKSSIESLLEDKEHQLSTKSNKRTYFQKIDVTEPGIRPLLGHTHLITQAIEEITAIFEKIGFNRVSYPEIEWDWYAFEALNFPENHPARDDWETFFMKETPHKKYGPMILTPHTSSGQIREMERLVSSSKKRGPHSAHSANGVNIKMLNIAKTYRRQADISHTPMFHQFETLVVGEGISIIHLKGVLDFFVRSYLGEKRKARIRPYQFQFTEPSFETDVTCGVCDGKGCRLCKDGWLELGGAGMVHPNVLRAGGIDPGKYTGFASGWGVERVLMMKEGMDLDDLRLIYSNNLDFLEQF